MINKKSFATTIIIQLIVCILIFIALTAFKFFLHEDFSVLANKYDEYARYDVNASLVYEGE